MYIINDIGQINLSCLATYFLVMSVFLTTVYLSVI